MHDARTSVGATADAGAELRHLVALNEGAKVVFARSHGVNLLAVDAIVRSRLAGGAVRGFAEVSTQMRAWSADLHLRMQALQESTVDIIATVSRRAKHARAARLLTAAAAHPSAAAALAAAGASTRARVDADDDSLRRGRRNVVAKLDELSRLGMMACVLSRAAKIEAVHAGDDHRTQLSQVADEFAASAEEVVGTVRSLLAVERREAR